MKLSFSTNIGRNQKHALALPFNPTRVRGGVGGGNVLNVLDTTLLTCGSMCILCLSS